MMHFEDIVQIGEFDFILYELERLDAQFEKEDSDYYVFLYEEFRRYESL